MGMQEDADTEDYPATVAGGAGMVAPCPTGPGGNYTLVNQNEAEILEASYEYTEVRHPTQPGYDEDASTVTPMFQEQAL